MVWQSLLLFSLLAVISSVAFGHRHFPSFSNSQSFVLFHLLYLLTLKFWLCLQFFSLWAPEIVFIIVMCGTFITAVAALPTVIQRLCCGKSDFRRLLYQDNVVFFVSTEICCDVSTGCCFCCSINLLPILLSYPVTVISVAVSTYCHFCCRIHLLSFLLPYPLTVISVARSTQPTCPYLTAIIVAYLCNHSHRSDQGK